MFSKRKLCLYKDKDNSYYNFITFRQNLKIKKVALEIEMDSIIVFLLSSPAFILLIMDKPPLATSISFQDIHL